MPRDGQLDCWNTSLELFSGVKISELTLNLNVAIYSSIFYLFYLFIIKILKYIYIFSIYLFTSTNKRIVTNEIVH